MKQIYRWLGLILTLSLVWGPLSLAQGSNPLQSRLGANDFNVMYCNADGTELRMDVYYPDAAQAPLPVVVYVHGGGWRMGDKRGVARFTSFTELRERGYLIVSVNYRLAPQAQFPAMIEDVKCAVRHLRARAADYGLDPNHIGAWGTSAGGHLVALLGVTDGSEGFEGDGGFGQYSSRVQAVVDMFGPTTLPMLHESNQGILLNIVFGVQNSTDEMLVLGSPTHWASPDDPPTLMLHGDQDDLVPLEQSEIFLDTLTAAGVDAELVVVKNGGHVFAPTGGPISPTESEIGRIVADFFDEHLR